MSEVIKAATSVYGKKLKNNHFLNVTIHFDGIDKDTILIWAAENRLRAVERMLQNTDDIFIESLNGCIDIRADDPNLEQDKNVAFKKLVDAGMPPRIARLATTSPIEKEMGVRDWLKLLKKILFG